MSVVSSPSEHLDSAVSLAQRVARRGSATSVEGPLWTGRWASDIDLCLGGRCGRGFGPLVVGLRGIRGGRAGGGGAGAL